MGREFVKWSYKIPFMTWYNLDLMCFRFSLSIFLDSFYWILLRLRGEAWMPIFYIATPEWCQGLGRQLSGAGGLRFG